VNAEDIKQQEFVSALACVIPAAASTLEHDRRKWMPDSPVIML
jgi:hypothetical protein